MFDNCSWIWSHRENRADEYSDFLVNFDLTDKKDVILDISADGNFEAYLNGELCAFGACADYPAYKFYDSFLLDELCVEGRNELKITVWHIGVNSSVYVDAQAGLIFQVSQNGTILSKSNENVLSRENPNYKFGLCKIITTQLGPGYHYDNSVSIDNGYSPSTLVDKERIFNRRNIDNLLLLPRIPVTVSRRDNSILIDFGKEAAGYIDIDLTSDCKQELLIVYGEHLLEDGSVPRKIGNRDFSIGFTAKSGENRFLGMMRRIAGRYMEVFFEDPIFVNYIGIRPVVYPLNYRNRTFESELHKRIYDVSAYTLECCMHEHYEDCPWREQALYSLDSRNQMLCGYIAFNEYRYPRYNIILLARSLHNGLLRITSPNNGEMPIPFFSLTFVQQVFEYVKYSGDRTVIEEVREALDAIMKKFADRIDGTGLIPSLPAPAWNFYEWSPGNEGRFPPYPNDLRYDLCLNAMYLHVLPMYEALGGSVSVDKDKLLSGLKTVLYDEEKGLFRNSSTDDRFSVIGNALAILAGAADRDIAERLVNDGPQITDVSLSMNGYLYDALLSVDDGYKDYIIKDIEEKYSYMLSQGATTFWETIEGWHAFNDAGSLCHGWSALPIYYLDLLGYAK